MLKKKFKSVMVAVVLAISLTTGCAAAAPAAVDNTPMVYVTNTGAKYHNEGCSYLKSSNAIHLDIAIKRGYSPCSRCSPPTE
jgi:hypothetical protein